MRSGRRKKNIHRKVPSVMSIQLEREQKNREKKTTKWREEENGTKK